MNLLIESTPTITTIDGTRCRVWRGTTEASTPCDVFVARISSADPYAQEALARELVEMPPPREAALANIEADRLREQPARLAPVVEAARRAVKGKGTISASEWEALCEAVNQLEAHS